MLTSALLFVAPGTPVRAQGSPTTATPATTTATTTATTVPTAAVTTTTAAPATTAPTTAAPVPPTAAAVPPTSAPPSTGPPITVQQPATTAASTSSTTTTTRPGPPPASLSDAAVSSILDGLARTSPSSTLDLLAALRPLQDFGLTPEAAAAAGMGRFPVAGPAFYRDDFGDPRETPEPHTHKGTDIFAAFGTPVRSPANGVLRYADEPAAGGLAAYVTEPDGTWFYLAHLQRFAPGLGSGATVKMGDVIGYNGDTGNAKGGAPHVHFEYHPRGGAAVNPKSLLDQWLAEARAAAPTLVAAFRQDVTRALTNVGIVRRFERGMLAGPSRLLSRPVVPPPDEAPEQRLSDALLTPLTPPLLLPPDPPTAGPNRP